MATQKGRNWSSGDIVTAANLSSIERGVSALTEEYTPTTWANGNTVTAAGLNNIEQGIVSSSSSDFSTAQVTIVNNGTYVSAEGTAMGVIYDASPEWDLSPATLPICTGTFPFSIAPLETAIYSVCLYKGHTILSSSGDVNVSGDAELIDSERGIYDITGDCTITIGDSPK